MHCGRWWGQHYGYCAGCGAPIVVQEQPGYAPMRGRIGRRGRPESQMPSRRAELAELSEQITAMREQLAALTERLEEIGAATED